MLIKVYFFCSEQRETGRLLQGVLTFTLCSILSQVQHCKLVLGSFGILGRLSLRITMMMATKDSR